MSGDFLANGDSSAGAIGQSVVVTTLFVNADSSASFFAPIGGLSANGIGLAAAQSQYITLIRPILDFRTTGFKSWQNGNVNTNLYKSVNAGVNNIGYYAFCDAPGPITLMFSLGVMPKIGGVVGVNIKISTMWSTAQFVTCQILANDGITPLTAVSTIVNGLQNQIGISSTFPAIIGPTGYDTWKEAVIALNVGYGAYVQANAMPRIYGIDVYVNYLLGAAQTDIINPLSSALAVPLVFFESNSGSLALAVNSLQTTTYESDGLTVVNAIPNSTFVSYVEADGVASALAGGIALPVGYYRFDINGNSNASVKTKFALGGAGKSDGSSKANFVLNSFGVSAGNSSAHMDAGRRVGAIVASSFTFGVPDIKGIASAKSFAFGKPFVKGKAFGKAEVFGLPNVEGKAFANSNAKAINDSQMSADGKSVAKAHPLVKAIAIATSNVEFYPLVKGHSFGSSSAIANIISRAFALGGSVAKVHPLVKANAIATSDAGFYPVVKGHAFGSSSAIATNTSRAGAFGNSNSYFHPVVIGNAIAISDGFYHPVVKGHASGSSSAIATNPSRALAFGNSIVSSHPVVIGNANSSSYVAIYPVVKGHASGSSNALGDNRSRMISYGNSIAQFHPLIVGTAVAISDAISRPIIKGHAISESTANAEGLSSITVRTHGVSTAFAVAYINVTAGGGSTAQFHPVVIAKATSSSFADASSGAKGRVLAASAANAFAGQTFNSIFHLTATSFVNAHLGAIANASATGQGNMVPVVRGHANGLAVVNIIGYSLINSVFHSSAISAAIAKNLVVANANATSDIVGHPLVRGQASGMGAAAALMLISDAVVGHAHGVALAKFYPIVNGYVVANSHANSHPVVVANAMASSFANAQLRINIVAHGIATANAYLGVIAKSNGNSFVHFVSKVGNQAVGTAHGNSSTVFNSLMRGVAGGSITISSSLVDPVRVTVIYNDVFNFSWNVQSDISKTWSFQWDIGAPILYYYQVEGPCLVPDPSVDFNLADSCPRYRIQTFAAYNLADLCVKYRLQFMNAPTKWPIKSIKRYSFPVFVSDDPVSIYDPTVNVFTEVPFCQIPECLDFCVDQLDVKPVLAVTMLEQIYTPTVTGINISFSGHATVKMSSNLIQGGALTLAGEAGIKKASWHYTSSGYLILEGQFDVVASNWSYSPNSGLELFGNAFVKATKHNFTSSGGFGITGNSRLFQHYVWSSPYAVNSILGESIFKLDYPLFETTGQLNVAGASSFTSTYFNYMALGDPELSGSAYVVSPYWSYQSSGILQIGGEVETVRTVIAMGGISTSGSAICAVKINFISSGEFVFDGSNVLDYATNWNYSASGDLNLDGTSGTNWLGVLDVTFNCVNYVDVQPVYPVVPINLGPAITAPAEIVYNNCSQLSAPNKLIMNHNLNNASVLKQFLTKNGFKFNDNLTLIYNKKDNTWRINQQWQDSNESWTIVIEWGCVNEVGAMPVN